MTRLNTRLMRRLSWLAPLFFGSLAFSQNGALRVTEPAPSKGGAIVTSEPAILLRGTLAWGGGDMRVLWESNRGFSDLAAVRLAEDGATVLWNSTVPLPLRPGINHIRIKALGQPGAATFVNIFYTPPAPAPPSALGTATLWGKSITYEVIGGLAVYQGDLILGKAVDVAAGRFAGRFSAGRRVELRPQSETIAPNLNSTTGLWPIVNGVVRVPYTMTSVNSSTIQAAIAESNTQLAGIIQWVPATAGDVNQVNFSFDPNNFGGGCEATVGMVGGPQPISGAANCTTAVVMHEMGHALGLFHEQSRADRNTYVTYMEQNVDKPQYGNFDINDSGVVSGLYNYASIMEYGATTLSRDGVSPDLETIPAGIGLGASLPQYTTGDLDGILRLYQHAPTAVTVDTNPSGLQVLVDGTLCTAPCVFANWTTGSQHTLSVPLDSHGQTVQTLSGQNYIFGRWNAGAAQVQTVTVTNSAGDGTLLRPTTSPAITNYLASFIAVHPYSPQVYGNHGTITATPSPGSLILNGVATNYYLDRQLITLTVHTNSGWSFYGWFNVNLFNLYSNPFTFNIISDFGSSVLAYLVSDPVTTITAASPDITAANTFPGFPIGIVETSNGNATTTAFTPANFDASFDGPGFAAGAHLTLCASGLNGTACPASPVAQAPVTSNITYLFGNWSGAASAATNGVNVVVPASGDSNYTANYTPSFRSIVMPSSFCTGIAVTASPPGTNSTGSNGTLDAFFGSGTVNFTAAAGSSGLNFVGWSQDLAGTTNPLSFSLSGQIIGTANYNVPGATVPLTVTGVSPASPSVTSGALDLTVNGAGFTTNSLVTYTYWILPGGQYSYRTNTLISSTQLVIHLQAGDLATAGYVQVAVLNAVASHCNPTVYYTFPVANTAGPPFLAITKSHTGNFALGQQNAQYTIQVTNTGTGSTDAPVTVTEAVPAGETLVSMSGTAWTCPPGGATCTRSDSLGPGIGYQAITATVNVAANATSPQVNSATVNGGGAPAATATDSTTISSQVTVPNVVGLTQSAAATAIQNAALVVGTVTMASSNSVPSGSVISESPVAGTMLNAGAPVNLVVSSGPVTLQSMAVTPANPSIAKGLTQQFAATGTYSDNSTQNLTAQVTWASATSATATITTGGLATAAGIGASTISAKLGAVTGSTLLTVTAPALQSIAVAPANPSIAKGLTQQFAATGTYSDSSTQNLTAQVTWASATLTTATITTGGLATGAGIGASTISAKLGAVSGSTVLTITAPTLQSIAVTPANPSVAKGLTQQFAATGTYTDNSTQNLTAQVTWASATLTTATITAGGLATGAGIGASTISATLGLIGGSTLLTVTAATLQSIAVTPANPSIAKGLTQQFAATGTYTDNSTQNLTAQVTWASATLTTATITAGGLATGAGIGASTISATLGLISGSTLLTVTAATLQSIAVSPANPSIAKGLTQQFAATGTYSDNSTQNLTAQVTWSSATLTTATITSGGLATAVAFGIHSCPKQVLAL